MLKDYLENSTFVYGDRVVIIILYEVPLGIVIENRDIAHSFRKYFEIIWETAKK